MTELIACLSTGKGTWMPVVNLINAHDWDQIFLVATEFAKEKFTPSKPVNYIIIDQLKPSTKLVDDIHKELQGKIKGTQVAVNFISGTGKEHMAIISALIKLGLSFRQIALTPDGVKEV